jgi:hypothetical protein
VRSTLQMVLGLLATNADHWLAHQLNAYRQDPHEYRATTRNPLQLSDTITYVPHSITSRLDRPTTPTITRIPGDPRLIHHAMIKIQQSP